MKQSDIEALIGRSLTANEVTHYKTYLNIAQTTLDDLICSSACGNDSEARTFEPREGYRTIFTGIFHEVSKVTVDGEVVTDYYPAQWDNRNASWYNSIVFATHPRGDVGVTADWGVNGMPSDLKMLLAKLFANVSQKYVTGPKIQSKQVEDFRITYGTALTEDEQFMADNQRVISKYSLCNVGAIRHGRISSIC